MCFGALALDLKLCNSQQDLQRRRVDRENKEKESKENNTVYCNYRKAENICF